jgi:hypothetical protein
MLALTINPFMLTNNVVQHAKPDVLKTDKKY